jgi:hypothetical protein
MSYLRINDRRLKVQGSAAQIAYVKEKSYIKIKLHFNSQTDFNFVLKDDYYYNCILDWGDGTTNNLDYFDDDGACTTTTSIGSSTSLTQEPAEYFSAITHTYQSGDYELKIDGKCETLAFTNNQDITEIVSWGDPETTNLSYIKFYGCLNLRTLPNESGRLKYVQSFKESFSKSNISIIPQGLFDDNSIALSFESTFNLCQQIISVPSNLFDTNTQVVNFDNTFSGCNNSSLDNDCAPKIWDSVSFPNVTTHNSTFYNANFKNKNTDNGCGETIPSSWK